MFYPLQALWFLVYSFPYLGVLARRLTGKRKMTETLEEAAMEAVPVAVAEAVDVEVAVEEVVADAAADVVGRKIRSYEKDTFIFSAGNNKHDLACSYPSYL